MTTTHAPGRIFTFYSYKGGTGRSMVLANVAWILASAGKRVLVIDWDLEAPGLHRYFRPFLGDESLASSEGLIEFAIGFATMLKNRAVSPSSDGETRVHKDPTVAPAWVREYAENIVNYRVGVGGEFGESGRLDMIPAGKQDLTYAARFSTFHWQNFYEQLGGGHLVNAMADVVREQYDYILIDSRTGVSDTAGICTVQLPDELVICFTYNNQSTEGAAGVARSVYRQRYLDGGDTSFRIHPVPMRVDTFEQDRVRRRRQYAHKLFAPLMEHVTGDRAAYLINCEIPSIPAFAYEEVLATFSDDQPTDPKGMLHAIIGVVRLLIRDDSLSFSQLNEPNEVKEVLAAFAAVEVEESAATESDEEDPANAAKRRAERAYLGLSEEDRIAAMRLWLRMVRVTGEEELSDLVGVRINVDELDRKRIPQRVIDAFVSAGVVHRGLSSLGRAEKIGPIDDTLLNRWPLITQWAEDHREFLQWRQSMRTKMAAWEEDRPWTRLLRPGDVRRARMWMSEGHDFSQREKTFIFKSRLFVRLEMIAAATVFVALLAVLSLYLVRSQKTLVAQRAKAADVLTKARAQTDPVEAVLLGAELDGLPEPKDGLERARDISRTAVPRLVLRGITYAPAILAFSPDGTKLVAARDDRETVWETGYGNLTNNIIFRGVTPGQGISSLAVSDDGHLVTGLSTGIVSTWSDSDPSNKTFRIGKGRLFVHWVTSANQAWTIDGEGVLIKGLSEPQKTKLVTDNEKIIGVDFSPDGKFAALSTTTRVRVFSAGLQPLTLIGIDNATDVSISPEKNLIAVAKDKTIALYSMSGNYQGRFVREHVVTTMDLSPTTGRMAWGETDGVVRVLDSPTAKSKVYTNLRGHKSAIAKVLFSPSGNELATADGDGNVRLWPANTSAVPPISRWEDVATVLRARTSDCLQPQRRIQLLGEMAVDANRGWAGCETGQGRLQPPAASVELRPETTTTTATSTTTTISPPGPRFPVYVTGNMLKSCRSRGNLCFAAGPVSLGGLILKKGILYTQPGPFTNGSASVDFDVVPGARVLRFTVGNYAPPCDDHNKTPMRVSVEVDGQLVWPWQSVTQVWIEQRVALPPNAKTVRLAGNTTDGPFDCDDSVWGNVRFEN